MTAGGDVTVHRAESTREPPTRPEIAVVHPDAGLVMSARRDPEAFAALYDRYAPAILRWFTRRTTSLDMAADLTAETFAQAYLSADSYRPERGEPRAWLFGIAHHVLARSLRRRAVEDRARRRLGIESVGVPDLAYERVEQLADLVALRPALHSALRTLSPRIREAVRLRIELGLPFDQVAERLGCSVNAARVRVTRGVQQLLARMEGP
ncbi:MAG TPA: RNA polymerase sigma factor [Acidimicrobiales bacterium]